MNSHDILIQKVRGLYDKLISAGLLSWGAMDANERRRVFFAAWNKRFNNDKSVNACAAYIDMLLSDMADDDDGLYY